MAGRMIRRLLRDERGLSAIELGLLAPLLILGLLAMIDIGISWTTRMEMDRNVRAGAQAAMSLNNDGNAIRAIVLASAAEPEGLAVEVGRTCSCAAVAASCAATCSGGGAPSVFYAITARRDVDGIFLGERTLESTTRIQIR
jgi:Flp pilus assembly protein TadG